MSKPREMEVKSAPETGVKHPKSISRRALLRGGVTAMPAILTLQSGAALARSSNLISAAPGSRNADDNALCMDTSTADQLTSGKWDYRDPGYGTVNVIPDADYYPTTESGKSGEAWTAYTFCEAGGSRKFHDGGWHQVDLPSNGIIVSANALNSVSSRVDFWLRMWS